MQKVKHDFQLANKQKSFANVYIIQFWFPCGADGRAGARAGGCTVKRLPKFHGWISNQIFLAMAVHARGAPLSITIT